VGLYDIYLAVRHRRHKASPPTHVALVLTEHDLLVDGGFDMLETSLRWMLHYGAECVTVSVSVLDDCIVPTLTGKLQQLDTPEPFVVHSPHDKNSASNPTAAVDAVDSPIRITVGLGGKAEFAAAVRELATDVDAGRLTPDAIDAKEVTDRLVLSEEPDLVIKTGAERLSDFAIWQSVYSELYFIDVNWRDFRRRDYLRAVLDFQDRQRRFGR